jgi:hypothetical protein
VELNVKFLLSLQKVSQLDAKIVLERTDHKEAVSAETEVSAEIGADLAETEGLTEAQEKCIVQLVLNVSRNVKYHLSLQKVNQFTVRNVL